MDPITMSVIGHSMVSTAEEMGVNLYQTAVSTVIREIRDIGTAVFDADGRTVAMANWIPMLMNAMEPAIQAIRRHYDIRALEPGEAVLTNDPFDGGQHVNDIVLFMPIHFEGRVIALSCANAHHVDVGGGAPSSYAGATEAFQEGIMFPPIKVDLGGDWTQTVFGKIFRNNIRVPEASVPDFDAQIAACRTGERRVLALAEKYGVDTLLEFMKEIQNYSERITRAAISDIPDGVYHGEAYMEDDGTGSGGPFTVRVALIVRGSEITVDFSATDPQARGFINIPLASTDCIVRTTLVSILGIGHRFVNAGAFRPIHIESPLGSIVNPARPAPTQGRTSTCYKIFDAINLALAPVLPEKVTAPGFDSQTGITFARRQEDGTMSICHEVMGGGNGGLFDRDGADGMIMHLTNGANAPIESVEIEYPFLEIQRYGLVQDSGGPGQFRGGMGMERAFRVRADGVTFGLHSDRHRHSAPALFGGHPGWPGRCTLIRNDSKKILGSKVSLPLERGDEIAIRSGGGAGYGPPEQRDADNIAKDLREDRISKTAASRDQDFASARKSA